MGIETTEFSKAINAAGLPRRKFSVADIYRMVEAGILAENERVELIDGEIIAMSPKGIFHETLKVKLNRFLARKLPENIEFAPETTFRLDELSYLEPDFVLYTSAVGLKALSGKTALLAVEVADSSLSYDLGLKQQIYARHNIPELWVIDARKLHTHVFLEPGRTGYARHDRFGAEERIAPTLIPEFAVTLAELGLATPSE